MANNKSTVAIPVATLNCIKSLLFSNDGEGVNLGPIVEDIAKGFDQPRDLIAINVGLVFKGIKPKFDDTPRHRCNIYNKEIESVTLVDASLITNMAVVKKTGIKWNQSTAQWETIEYSSETTKISLDTFFDSYCDSLEESKDKIEKRYPNEANAN